jgi:hypothetical protein
MPCFVERTGFTGGGAVPAARRSPAPPAQTPPFGPAVSHKSWPSPARQPAATRAQPDASQRAAAPSAREVQARAVQTTGTVRSPAQTKTHAAPETQSESAKANRAKPNTVRSTRERSGTTSRERQLLTSIEASHSALQGRAKHGDLPGLGRFVDALDRTKRSASLAVLVAEREADYLVSTHGSRDLRHVTLDNGMTYSYDSTAVSSKTEPDNRLVAAWGVSGTPVGPRQATRLSGFPSPAGKGPKPLDRGHVVSHAAGGTEDGINLLPQDRELNRGWGTSADKRRWRAIERDLAARTGTPFVVRPQYIDDSDFPGSIEVGVQASDGTWEFHVFNNR